MRAKIRKKETVAKQTDYVEFDTGQEVRFTPGQYFFVTLNPSDELHKDDLTHHLSIVNSPSQKNTLALTTRMRVDRSLFKRTLADAKVGDEVEIGKISGTFVLPDSTDKPIVLIALGIGITPFISILRHCDETRKPYKFTLIYSDGETESMPFLEELEGYEDKHDGFKLIEVVTQDKDWQGEKRHIDANLLKECLSDEFSKSLFYVSGPPRPVEEVGKSIKLAGVSEENIKLDDFSGY